MAVVKLLGKSPSEHGSAFYKGLRLMGIDGTLLDCPDTDSNCEAFGRTSNQTSHGAFPKVRVVSLCELRTRVLWRSIIGAYHQSEQKLTLPLLKFLDSKMLLLADRHFGVAPIIYPLLTQKVPFLIRVKKSQVFLVEKVLCEGSYLSTIFMGAQDAVVELMRISFTGALDIFHTRLPETKRGRPMRKVWLRELILEIG